ncbi:MAG: DUF484 family protein [Alphaproteobacteria bacterium]
MTISNSGSSSDSNITRIEPKFVIQESSAENASVAGTEAPTAPAEIVNFTSARNQKLETKKEELESNLKNLIRAGTMTTINLKRVERSVLGLTAAYTIEDLLQEYATKLAPNMAVDYVSLCLESESGRLTHLKIPGVYWLTPGSLDAAMHDQEIIMSSSGDEYVRVFGQDATNINSCALVQLEMPELRTRGVLAFGTKAHGYFSPEQGTELVSFLGKISEKLLSRAFLTAFTNSDATNSLAS